MSLFKLKVSHPERDRTTTLHFTDGSEAQTAKWALEDEGYEVEQLPEIKIFQSVDSALDSVTKVMEAS